ncbi:MAG: formylglycine-generating enzyme family protein [Desulfobacteraceae bacterium]|nr:MAG: formylglycine-generating enzyme family protein [Desulfobacteraceae bacterium]
MNRIHGGTVLWLALVFFLFGPIGLSSSHSQERIFKNSLGMEFVLIPAGSFEMGSPPEEPSRYKSEILHRVSLSKPLYVQTSEVTVEQWTNIMGKRLLKTLFGPKDLPVTKVSWFDCMEFVEKMNSRGEGTYRLPTEAEWEYACRAGAAQPFHWGAEIDCSKAMYGNSSKKAGECVGKSKDAKADGPARVRSYSPNGWGLYDMHGNVWEWCQDWFSGYTLGWQVDPAGPETGSMKVRRGGSWLSEGHRLRCANRAYAHPASRFASTGLRLVREPR